MALISREIDTATSTECSEEIASAKEETPIKIPGEDFEDKKEEKPIDTDAVVDSGLPIEKGLPPTDLKEKYKARKIQKTLILNLKNKIMKRNGQSKDLEKHAEDASEARESMQNTDLEKPSGQGAITAEVNSKRKMKWLLREGKRSMNWNPRKS
ncbi:hypothetical protein OIU76_019731 [Salix suchowensis]|nr:hypothetical protein OIU76_019731 [Salix suchowensis]